MLFSQRKGHKPVSQIIQRDGISQELRNTLWNILDLSLWRREGFLDVQRFQRSGMDTYSTLLWLEYFKRPIDIRPRNPWEILKEIRNHFFRCEWYEVYDFLEFTLGVREDAKLTEAINAVLASELSAYRFIGNVCTDITDEQEIQMLEAALADNDYPGVTSHLKRALELLSNRENPDYRNSIKESISAVESLAKSITGRPQATLVEALSIIEHQGKMHQALLKGFSALYGYTSDEGGIRHAMLKETNLTPADAKFFLMSCTSFIHYLKSKL